MKASALLVIALAAAGLTVVTGPAAATVGLSTDSGASVIDGTTPSDIDQRNAQPGPSLDVNLHASSSHGDSTVNGTIEFGSISGSVSSNSVDVQVSSGFFGIWEDTYTVEGLPSGTPVSLLFTLDYTATTNCSAAIGREAQATVAFSVTAPNTQQIIDETDSCNSSINGPMTFLANTTSGTTLQLEGQLNIFAGVFGGSSSVDPPTLFFIDPLTEGAFGVTGSGHDYASPATTVPEPASLALLGIGIAGLAFVRRRAVL